jgi:SPP1 family predicted phage head-tail adaptor
MRAGDLRHRVRIQKRSVVTDTFGAQSHVWTDVATVWADISPMSGRELLAAQAINVDISHVVTIRYQPQFASPKAVAAMRILYGERIFNISAPRDVDERHRQIELQCAEGLNDG